MEPSRSAKPSQASTFAYMSDYEEDQKPSQVRQSALSKYKPRIFKLSQAEKHWSWKAGIRVATLFISIIGIGCAGWMLSKITGANYIPVWGYGYGYVGDHAGAIALFASAFIWCTIAVTLPLVFKRTRPLHPGIAVGLDLAFWGGFLAMAVFSISAVFSFTGFGTGSYLNDPSFYNSNYMGHYYYEASNNTWIYNITQTGSGHYNYTTNRWENAPYNLTGIVRTCSPFASCEVQDQWVNSYWRGKTGRVVAIIIINAACFLNLLLFFTLFVWACVDTHRYNVRMHAKKRKEIADEVIADLSRKGIVNVKDGVVQPPSTS